MCGFYHHLIQGAFKPIDKIFPRTFLLTQVFSEDHFENTKAGCIGSFLYIKMRKVYFWVLLFILTDGAAVAESDNQLSLSTVLSAAKEDRKMVLIEFFSYNSIESKIAQSVLASPGRIQQLLEENYLRVSIDIDKEGALREKYRVSQAPTLVILRFDGIELDRISGAVRIESLTQSLLHAADGETQLSDLHAQRTQEDLKAMLVTGSLYLNKNEKLLAFDIFESCLAKALEKNDLINIQTLRLILMNMNECEQPRRAILEKITLHRDQVLSRMNEDITDIDFLKLATLNAELADSANTTAQYFLLKKKGKISEIVFRAAFLPLVKQSLYKEATEHYDLELFVYNAFSQRERVSRPTGSWARLGTRSRKDNDRRSQANEENLELWAAAAIESLLATDRVSAAKRLAWYSLERAQSRDEVMLNLIKSAVLRSKHNQAEPFIAWVQTIQAEKK